jgi:thioredoxin reductase/ferredoxin
VDLEVNIIWGLTCAVSVAVVVPYLLAFRRRVAADRERKAEATALGVDRPSAQYPYVDPMRCIGCGACVRACPEGDVLGVVGGTAVVVNGLRCVGHGRCEIACPVGAIEVGLGDLKSRSDVPLLDESLETSVPGLFVAGELGGLSLVRNAVAQGRDVVEEVARRLAAQPLPPQEGVLDLVIVGAGPAGLSAGMTAAQHGLDYLLLEREADLGGSILHYPRRKMVLTQPVELAPWGKLTQEEYSKEHLLDVFSCAVQDLGLRIRFRSVVDGIARGPTGFDIAVSDGLVSTRFVLLALGRRGTPRKLGVAGEERPKVMYRLLDAESYKGQRLLVVGGGDSAVEAAVGLALQSSNEVTLSYRRDKLVRIKKKNQDRADALIASGKIRTLFPSQVVEIGEGSVRLTTSNGEEEVELDNDYVFVFAGGVPPFGLLKEAGVAFGGEAGGAS